MGAPAVYDIVVYAGATFRLELTWQDEAGVPIRILPTYAARMQIRQKVTSLDAMISISSGTGEIKLDAPAPGSNVARPGVIMIRIPATVTELMLKDGVYDLELYSPTDATEVERLIQGKATLSKEVTQP